MSAPIIKPYATLPDYADEEYVDGKLAVARGILSRTTDPDLCRRWLETVDILLDQRRALAAVIAPTVLDLDDPYFDGQSLPDALSEWPHVHSTTGVCVKHPTGEFCEVTP